MPSDRHLLRRLHRLPAALTALLVSGATPLIVACQGPTPSAPSAPMVAPSTVAVAAKPASGPSAKGDSAAIDPLRRLAEPPSGAYLENGGAHVTNVKVHCVLADDGEVTCVWGDLPPKKIPGVGRATQIVAGHSRVCALERAGTVVCFSTQTNTSVGEPVTLPFRVRRIAGSERGVVLEAEDGHVHYCGLPLDEE